MIIARESGPHPTLFETMHEATLAAYVQTIHF